MGAFVRWLALTALALGLATAAIADPAVERPPKDPEQIRWDPAIRTGGLANGLRYAVMHNATPSGGVSIRLGVDVGAADERDDELGAAHFLEHMAFGGSHAQLQADVEKTFADAGVAFGRDRNAITHVFDTTYKIDLPRGDAAALDLGFRWLRQVADGAQLTPETVDRERGVILAERETRLSGASVVDDQLTAMQLPGTRLARGPAIGTVASIDGLTAATLQAFYDRWYQPQNAAVVAVGDESLDDLEKRVRDTFGSWRGRGPPAVRKLPAADPKRGVEVLGLSAANTLSGVAVCRIGPPSAEPPGSFARWRGDIAAQLEGLVFSSRLTIASRTPSSGLVSGRADMEDLRGFGRAACVNAFTLEGAWDKGLATVQQEAAALDATPPREDELEWAIGKLRNDLRGERLGAPTRHSDALADTTLTALIDGKAEPSPAEAIRVFDVAVEGLTPADLQGAFHREWAGAGPLIAVVAATPPGGAAIRAAWLRGIGAAAPAEQAPAETWNYVSFGKLGKVVKRESVADGGYLRVTFANGVILNFKHSDSAKNAVALRVRFGAGRRELSSDDYFVAALGGAIVSRGGLQRDSFLETNAVAAANGVTMTPLAVGDDAFAIGAEASTQGAETALQLLAGYLSEPAFHDLDALTPTLFKGVMRMVRGYPTAMAVQSLTDTIAPGNPTSIPQLDKVANLTGADFARVLKPIMTGSPLEVTIVGDIDEAAAITDTAETFGALPARRTAPQLRTDTWYLRFPEHPPALIQGAHDGAPEKAAVAAVWPLFVGDPARRREEYALTLAAQVYQDAMLRRIRGELGKSYSPAAQVAMRDHADQGYLIAVAEVGATDVEQTRTEMVAIAGKVAHGDFTDQDLDNVRKPLLAALALRMDNNATVAEAMHTDVGDERPLKDLREMADVFGSITPAEVRKAAADWLSTAPIVVVVTGHAAAPAATPAKAAP